MATLARGHPSYETMISENKLCIIVSKIPLTRGHPSNKARLKGGLIRGGPLYNHIYEGHNFKFKYIPIAISSENLVAYFLCTYTWNSLSFPLTLLGLRPDQLPGVKGQFVEVMYCILATIIQQGTSMPVAAVLVVI